MFGAHLSIAGGMHNALLEAEKLGHTTVQVFTKSQKIWACKPLDPAAISDWSSHCSRLKFKHTVSHDSYLINLASPDEAMWNKSIDTFVIELQRCDQLGIPYLVMHPGAHLGTGEAAGLKRIIKALNAVHKRLKKSKTITCLEITAGQGSALGHTLEQLAAIQDGVKDPERLGVCLDTAHLFAAGYDFRGRRYSAFKNQLERTVGVDAVKVLHLNDSKKPLGSRVDRHEHIGRGTIGLEGFRPFVRDKLFRNVPKIMELPDGNSPDGRPWAEVNIEALRSQMD